MCDETDCAWEINTELVDDIACIKCLQKDCIGFECTYDNLKESNGN